MAEKPQVVVIGAGPAGLTAAFELVKRDVPVTVLEGDAMVGGITQTTQLSNLAVTAVTAVTAQ